MKPELIEKFKKIKMLLLDCDGVLTNGSILYNSEGKELIAFDVYDGYGITNAINNGIIIGLITGRSSEAVRSRAESLGIVDYFEGAVDKLTPFNIIKEKYKLNNDEIAYMGDDILDLPLLQVVGLSIAPRNARREVKRIVDFITKNYGGKGAVREVIDYILEYKKNIGE